MSNHIYKDHALQYLEKGYSVIPDKYASKMPAIKGWNEYSKRLPTESEALGWINAFTESNIAVALGEASGVIAVDVDTTDPELLEYLRATLPESPCERIGSKGFVRFYRYSPIFQNYVVKNHLGVVMEILSDNKKVTIAPSKHPSGMDYKWTGKSLVEVTPEELPHLPPYFTSTVETFVAQKSIGSSFSSSGRIVNGRNDALSKYCGELINEAVSFDVAVEKLIEMDKELHPENPYLSDHEEHRHSEPRTNAAKFYISHLDSVNSKRFHMNQEYEIPILPKTVNEVYKEEIMGKSGPLKVNQERKKLSELPKPLGILKDIQEYILAHSFVKQDEFAFSAALAIMSTLVGRKVTFLRNAPNLYLLNVAPSGSGKDAPQQCAKELLISAHAEHLLGAGDYVSDAALTDSLPTQPVRLDIIDEASGLLKSINKGGDSYNSKMADILCELYTTSNSKYLGRKLAEGVKGEVCRPCVSVLMSTTPRGFEEGVTIRSIEKGLMGRILIFNGDPDKPAERIREFPKPSEKLLRHLRHWAAYQPEGSGMYIGQQEQRVLEVSATGTANTRLDELFKTVDDLRRSTDAMNPELPIIARMFQMTCKLALISACARMDLASKYPIVGIEDVEFAWEAVLHNFEIFKVRLGNNVYQSPHEKEKNDFVQYLDSIGGTANRRQVYNKTRHLTKNKRDELIRDLIEAEEIESVTMKDKAGNNLNAFRRMS